VPHLRRWSLSDFPEKSGSQREQSFAARRCASPVCTGQQHWIYSTRAVTVKPLDQNESIPLHNSDAETGTESIQVPQLRRLAGLRPKRDIFVIERVRPCAYGPLIATINSSIRRASWRGSLGCAQYSVVVPTGE
jgi:hypothetical protein